MKLIYTKSKKQYPVFVGFVFTSKKGELLEVVTMEKPYKPSSSGKVTCKYPDGSMREYFTHVHNMEWIEREDRGEQALDLVCEMYNHMYDIDIRHEEPKTIMVYVRQVDLAHLRNYPEYAIPLLDWIRNNLVLL